MRRTRTLRMAAAAAGLLVAMIAAAAGAAAGAGYERAGWVAAMPPGAHDAQGVATIVSATQIRVEHFSYDGGAPRVYFYLGRFDDDGCFAAGLELPPLLERAYDDESLLLTLPGEQTMDGWGAISVWCAAFDVNFTSASFVAPCRADIDGSRTVGFDDLLAVLAAWGPCPQKDPCAADIDASGAVDFDDLLAVLAAWGPCPSPEEGSC